METKLSNYLVYFRIKFRSKKSVPSQENEPTLMPAPNYPQFESHFLAFMNSLDTNAAYRFENTKVLFFAASMEC